MRGRDWLFLASTASAAMLVYGAVGESNHPVVDRYNLRLPRWPKERDGYKIALLGDFHVRDRWSKRVAQKAIALALAEGPDMMVLTGDFIGRWKAESLPDLQEALEGLKEMVGRVVAVPGNHDYMGGPPELLLSILNPLDVKFLRNEVLTLDGIQWAGIDSRNKYRDDPVGTFAQLDPDRPSIVLWHEPDGVDDLPMTAALQLSGHSHGGQFRFPGGFTPMHTKNGKKYVRGFYPEAPTPIFVTRGIGTTGPPSRFLCPPEVAILTLRAG